jgi:HemY protein
MKLRWIILIVLAIGFLLGPFIKDIPGFVIIGYENTSIQTKLWQLLVLLAVLVVFIILIYQFLGNIFSSAGRLKNWSGNRKWRKARKRTISGMIALAEGEWSKAEKLFISAIAYSDTRLINYLASAQAAQAQQAYERRDNYLKQALTVEPNAEVAVGLTQAQLQYNCGQFEQALATLTHLHKIAPKHSHVLLLLSKLYLKLNDWQHYLTLVPELSKAKCVEPEELDKQLNKVWKSHLSQLAKSQGIEAVQDQWQKIPKKMRTNNELICHFAGLLIKHNDHLAAEKIISKKLKQTPSDELIYLYGFVEFDKKEQQLAFVEGLEKHFSGNATWLLTLGRLCLQQELWGKARTYLEQSLALSKRAETYQQLALAFEALGDSQAANRCYREGIDLAIER